MDRPQRRPASSHGLSIRHPGVPATAVQREGRWRRSGPEEDAPIPPRFLLFVVTQRHTNEGDQEEMRADLSTSGRAAVANERGLETASDPARIPAPNLSRMAVF